MPAYKSKTMHGRLREHINVTGLIERRRDRFSQWHGDDLSLIERELKTEFKEDYPYPSIEVHAVEDFLRDLFQGDGFSLRVEKSEFDCFMFVSHDLTNKSYCYHLKGIFDPDQDNKVEVVMRGTDSPSMMLALDISASEAYSEIVLSELFDAFYCIDCQA